MYMFSKLGPIDFKIDHIFEENRGAILVWRFSAQLFGKPWEVPGISFLQFDEDGKVKEHLDYWDSGRNFYANLPLIGKIFQLIHN